MKASQLLFVASVLGELKSVPQRDLTQEKIATVFAGKLEQRYSANFNRHQFFANAGVSPRLAEDAEEKKVVRTASGHARPFAPVQETPAWKGCS